MGKFFWGFVGLIMIFVGVYYYVQYSPSSKFRLFEIFSQGGTINFTTQDFENGLSIPEKFTCEGSDISPNFYVGNVPLDTKSLVLIMEDVSMQPQPFTHWINFNLSPDTTFIESAKILGNANTGVNDFGNARYDGPCPPLAENHKYVFRIYALNSLIDLQNPRRLEIDKVMNGHIVGTGTVTGVYSRNSR